MFKTVLSVVVVAGIVIVVMVFKNKSVIAPEGGNQTVCTQDAKLCPDGSYVSRQGPNCEFAPCPQPSPEASAGAATPQNKIITITFANGVATPNVATIKIGDTVKFINNDTSLRWPASGVHPTHQICPGFDSLKGLKTGESYSFTFNTAKACPWHDHLKPAINGKIEVAP